MLVDTYYIMVWWVVNNYLVKVVLRLG